MGVVRWDQVGRVMINEDNSAIDLEWYMDKNVKIVEGNNHP